MNILGISAFYHDSAAAIVSNGKIIAAAQEERFSRIKHDACFPINAIRYCLSEAGISNGSIDAVAFYEKPVAKFVRILETYFSVAPKGLNSFLVAVPQWLRKKLWIPLKIERELDSMGISISQKIFFPEHHESHAASAFFPSPFQDSTILTIDGVGEWATSTIGYGQDNQLTIFKELRFPHSLGLLYSAFTYFIGFKVNSGEYKLMGLAPYGEPIYRNRILKNLIDLKKDGSFRLNLDYFGYMDGLHMTNELFSNLFDGPPRKPETEITTREMNIARSIQDVTEEVVLRMGRFAQKETGCYNICMAGGVALNCVANGRLLRDGPFKNIWVQPASGDAGGALGAALAVWHMFYGGKRQVNNKSDAMQGTYLGPSFTNEEISGFLKSYDYPMEFYDKSSNRSRKIAELIADQKVIGLFQGRMEFGPRALGNRSIIGDARSPVMQSIMNLKIKQRESFRPFAPSCLEERVSDYFFLDRPSPYMLLVTQVKDDLCVINEDRNIDLQKQINQVRSTLPAITHVDYSARVQTVNNDTNPEYYQIIKAFEKLTGYGIIINTSFNVRGEPIVSTPKDAYRCFMRTEMDYLVLGSYILNKLEQPLYAGDEDQSVVLSPD